MVSEPKMNNREGASIDEQRSTQFSRAIAQKGSRSPPGEGGSTIERMDHDVSILCIKLRNHETI